MHFCGSKPGPNRNPDTSGPSLKPVTLLGRERGIWTIQVYQFRRRASCGPATCVRQRPYAHAQCRPYSGCVAWNFSFKPGGLPIKRDSCVATHHCVQALGIGRVSLPRQEHSQAAVTCYHALRGVAQDGGFVLPELQVGEWFMLMIGKTCHPPRVGVHDSCQ